MIPVTANWSAAFNKSGQQPTFVLSLPGLGLSFTTRQGVAGLNPTNTYMQTPTGVTQSISDLQGKATTGSLTITIVDKNRSLLAMFANTIWYGQQAQLFLGAVGLAWPTDYAPAWSGIVMSVAPTTDHTGWVFTIQDDNRTLKNLVYQLGNDNLTAISKSNPRTLYGSWAAVVNDLFYNQLGLTTAQVDTAAFSALGNGPLAAAQLLFGLTKAQTASSFLQNEMLLPFGLFSFVRSTGAISVGDMLAPPSPVTTAFTFPPASMIGVPAFGQKNLYNWLTYQLNYDGSNYHEQDQWIDGTSSNDFGLQNNLAISSQGLRSIFQGSSRSAITARRIFLRYANGPTGIITLDHPSLQCAFVEVADYVAITQPLLEDLDNGSLGVTNRLYQVMGVQPDWANGMMHFTLLDVNTLASRAALQLAPDSVPAWTSASPAQRAQYLFQANANSQQSDGTPAGCIF